jgi:signal peptidase I
VSTDLPGPGLATENDPSDRLGNPVDPSSGIDAGPGPDPGTGGAGTGAGGAGSGGGAGGEGSIPSRRTRRRRRARRWAYEWVVILLIAVLVAFLLRTFVIQTFYIPSASMTPTLQVGDRIVVNKLSYHLHSVHRGDIIVFKRPPNENCAGPPVPDLVKRVIGLPGETISDRHGTVYINGKALDQSWLPKHTLTTYTAPFAPVKIAANHYFVMGDDRVDSCDSRDWGTVPRSYVVGKVDLRIWPLSRIAIL